MIWQRATCFREINDSQKEGGTLLQGDALSVDLTPFLGQAQMVYLDPPYLGGGRFDMKMRVGEKGWETSNQALILPAFFEENQERKDYLEGYLRPLIKKAKALLHPTGSLFLHVDERFSAHARLLLDEELGEDNYRNEIIWRNQKGGSSLRFFGRKHETLLFYAMSDQHHFDITKVPVQKKQDRRNHLKRQVDEHGRAYRSIVSGGKEYIYYDDEPVYPDDVWDDVSHLRARDPQRTGYPTQRPQALLDRLVLSTTKPGDLVVDLTCGSGTALYSAAENGRRFLGVDNSPLAFSVCRKRLSDFRLVCKADLSDNEALLDASSLPGIGYYTVSINAFTLPDDTFLECKKQPARLQIEGLDAIDQWHAGLLQNGVFTCYASALRLKQSPRLPSSLQVPLLRGTLAVMVIDVLGRRTLWAGSGAV